MPRYTLNSVFAFHQQFSEDAKVAFALLRKNNEPKAWACMETGLPQTESLWVRFFRLCYASGTTSTSWDSGHFLPSSNQDDHTGFSTKLTVPEHSKAFWDVLSWRKCTRSYSVWLPVHSAFRNKTYKLWSHIWLCYWGITWYCSSADKQKNLLGCVITISPTKCKAVLSFS